GRGGARPGRGARGGPGGRRSWGGGCHPNPNCQATPQWSTSGASASQARPTRTAPGVARTAAASRSPPSRGNTWRVTPSPGTQAASASSGAGTPDSRGRSTAKSWPPLRIQRFSLGRWATKARAPAGRGGAGGGGGTPPCRPALVVDGEGRADGAAVGGGGALRPAGVRGAAPGPAGAAAQAPVEDGVGAALQPQHQGYPAAVSELGDGQA